MGTPPLPPEAGDPIGGWSVENAAEPDATTPALAADEPPPRPRPTRRERPPVERPPRPAGHALVVVVLALAVSLLLNAPGLHKSAHAQPAGWERDVALGVTGPLDAVSGALLLDRPREGVKALLGRSDDDDIDTEIALPPAAPATGTPTAPAPTVRRTFTREKPMRLWVAGDSLVVVPGQSIVRASGVSPVIEPVGGVEGRVATGLERPDVFNWFRYIPERMRELEPNVVVLSFGGNDDHGYMTGLPDGVELDSFGSDSWRAEYARRVGGLFDTIARKRRAHRMDRPAHHAGRRADTALRRDQRRRRSRGAQAAEEGDRTSTRTRPSPPTRAASPSTSTTRRGSSSGCALPTASTSSRAGAT